MYLNYQQSNCRNLVVVPEASFMAVSLGQLFYSPQLGPPAPPQQEPRLFGQNYLLNQKHEILFLFTSPCPFVV